MDQSGHCLSFYPPKMSDMVATPSRRGWREASTFAGFCDQHDGMTFAPLEHAPFAGTPEQCFLLAYRAQCHELYQKQASARSHEPIRQILDRGTSPDAQRTIQGLQGALGAGVRKGLLEARRNKAGMDTELLCSEYAAWRTMFVLFEGHLAVVSTGCPTPNRMLSGAPLQVLHDETNRFQPLYFAVVRAAGAGGAITFAWRPNDSAPSKFVNELCDRTPDRLPGILAQFMFAYGENTYFSEEWWSSVPETVRRHIARLATMGNPYYAEWHYRDDVELPWRVKHVGAEWPAG